MATKKSETQELEVRNKIVLVWVDDDGNSHEHAKLLKRPKGKPAREFMPKVLGFLSEIGDYQTELDKNQDDSLSGQTEMITRFQKYEDLFPFILQLQDGDKVTDEEGMRILNEELTTVELMEPVFKAAEYIVSESLHRPEVEQALKKSDGEEPKEEAS